MLSLLLVASWLFLLTHVDTFVVLVAFCADDRYTDADVFFGGYVGFVGGLVLAIGATVAVDELLRSWTFLLGTLPIGLGIWTWLRRSEAVEPLVTERVADPVARSGVVAVAALGLSGENIAVYVPFFIELSTGELGIVVLSYLAGAVLLFLAASATANRGVERPVPAVIESHLVPALLVLVGLVVIVNGLLLRSGTCVYC